MHAATNLVVEVILEELVAARAQQGERQRAPRGRARCVGDAGRVKTREDVAVGVLKWREAGED